MYEAQIHDKVQQYPPLCIMTEELAIPILIQHSRLTLSPLQTDETAATLPKRIVLTQTGL